MFRSKIISFCEEYSTLPGEHLVQPSAGGDGHQLGVHIILVVIGEGEAAVGDEVEREGEHRDTDPGSILAVPDDKYLYRFLLSSPGPGQVQIKVQFKVQVKVPVKVEVK